MEESPGVHNSGDCEAGGRGLIISLQKVHETSDVHKENNPEFFIDILLQETKFFLNQILRAKTQKKVTATLPPEALKSQ